jgi:hypothetical protein
VVYALGHGEGAWTWKWSGRPLPACLASTAHACVGVVRWATKAGFHCSRMCGCGPLGNKGGLIVVPDFCFLLDRDQLTDHSVRCHSLYNMRLCREVSLYVECSKQKVCIKFATNGLFEMVTHASTCSCWKTRRLQPQAMDCSYSDLTINISQRSLLCYNLLPPFLPTRH